MTSRKNKTLEKLRRQSVKSALDVLLLAELRNGAMSGYDAIGYIHNKFGVLLSSGTIYAHLYALEREGLVTSSDDAKKRVYSLTEEGEQTLEQAYKANVRLLQTIDKMLSP
ncbi:MAG: PadR family transcriptional regulator [Candidatus Bathyarchaeota archaeon]